MGYRVNKPYNTGITLLELLVAITLAAITTTFIFSSYLDVFHGFKIQAKRAEQVREMVLVKTRINNTVRNVQSLILIVPDKLMFLKRGDSTMHTVEFHNTVLYCDGKLIQGNLKNFVFRPSEKKTVNGLRTLSWEGVLGEGGWFGGVIIANDMTP
jgi:hypothetical protein